MFEENLFKTKQIFRWNCFSSRLDRLYAVSGGSGNDRAMGFTFDARPESFGQLISTWKPNHVNFLFVVFFSFRSISLFFFEEFR